MAANLTLGAMALRQRDLRQSIEYAHNVGYTGIGISIGECLAALEAGLEPTDIRRLLDSRNLELSELELIRLGGTSFQSRMNDALVELVAILKPNRVHVAAFDGEPAVIQQELRDLCRLLPETTVAVEFMPYSKLPDIESTMDLLAGPGCEQATMVLDAIHFFRSGASFTDLTPEVLERVSVLQLSDLTDARTDTRFESRHLRTFPGHGNLDLHGLLHTLCKGRPAGVPPITVEPFSDAIDALPLPWVVHEAFLSASQLLRECNWPTPLLTYQQPI
ncbi:sugar phosphate isomerase/epimerase family protein [Arthrobacter sp. SAFR-014]|uniref:sugar phosphate isomerase/epimerase family protein n=1 Tax=unclassified Arthrobacter TaxID=235627 RepID=UPI003F7BA5EF